MSFTNKGLVLECAADESVTIDGFDDCITTVVESIHGRHVVYNQGKVINKLMSRDGMDREEAVEFYYYNIVGAYVGEMTPMFDLQTPDTY
jgi:hypothetical protein